MILITGAGGFVGSNLARNLAEKGERVVALTRRPMRVPSFLAPFWNNQVKEAHADILDLPGLLGVMKAHSVDSIIHCAVMTIREGPLYQALKTNLEGTMNVLEAARALDIPRVTFISSATVYYGVKTTQPYHEDSYVSATSNNFVGANKIAEEQICFQYAKEYGIAVSVVRPPRIYGRPSPPEQSLPGHLSIESLVQDALAHRRVNSNIYGGARADFTHVKDVAKGIALVHLAKAPKHAIYNVGSGCSSSYLDVAQAIRELVPGAEFSLGAVAPEGGEGPPPLSIERIKNELGYTPDYGLRRGIKACVEWLKERKY
ncbi:MAG: NAD(P)-dependent oxidoreductase [Chloroflexi bacterium]|nr:NAD(P)-dependent oxidoreductase [Chloroflexota bacterium]